MNKRSCLPLLYKSVPVLPTLVAEFGVLLVLGIYGVWEYRSSLERGASWSPNPAVIELTASLHPIRMESLSVTTCARAVTTYQVPGKTRTY